MSTLPPGSKLGRFEISTVLGQGAMGVVYLANDPEIERPVAIKTVRPEAMRGESAAEIEARFLKEAKLAGRLQHPSIVTVYDVGRDRDVCFIAMEYVDGKPLTRYLTAADTLPLSGKIGIIRQVAEALAHAHERGVLHRDIKPGNILIAKDGRVKVTDFGIGKFTAAATSELTRTGQMVGSPAYMSPEQVRGEKVDARSDLFSLGVVLYELLTGVRPFPGESITTLVYQILHTEPRDPRELKVDLPMSTREVLACMLAKQPAKRPANAKEFVRELKRIEKFQRDSEMTRRAVVAVPTGTGGTTTAAAPPPGPPPLPPVTTSAPTEPAGGRRGLPLVLLAAAVVVIAAFLLLRERGGTKPPSPASPEPQAAAALPSPAAEASASAAEATPVVLPTPGPDAAADATVGAPRVVDPTRRRPTPQPLPPAAAPPEEKVASVEPPRAAAPGRPERVDAVYATRRGVRFTSSPEQARLYVDGRYIGIADDWDNRGGGRQLEFEKSGTHYVRMELPGYRPMHLQIDVTSEGDDSVSIDEELDRNSKVPYEKLPSVSERTTGEVEFLVHPSDAVVSEGERTLGPASSFGPGSPLRLRGPMVHDFLLSAPGYKPKLVRILVSENAGKDRARVEEKLKSE